MKTKSANVVRLLIASGLLIGRLGAPSPLCAQRPPDGSVVPAAARAQSAPRDGRGDGSGPGMGMMGGRGVEGTVTATSATELTIKTELGETYKVQFNQNTHFMKDRQPAKSADIKVGEAIMAGGNIDAQAKTVGAAFVGVLDADQVKRIQEMRASYGKTWLAGKIKSIDETKIMIIGVDGKPASFLVDESTSFKKRKDSITLGDVKAGDAVTVRGALKGGIFTATEFQLMGPRGERRPGGGPEEGQTGGVAPPGGPNH